MIQTEPWVAPASELRKSHSENGAELWGGLCCHRTDRQMSEWLSYPLLRSRSLPLE